MSTVFSMDPVGTTNACSSVDVPNNSISMVTVHSEMKFLTSGLDWSAGSLVAGCVAGLVLGRVAMDELERAIPPGLGEEMLEEIDNVIGANCGIGQAIGRGVVRPVNDQRLTDNVFAGNESPIPAVERIIPVIAHRKIRVRRHY